MPSIPTSSRLRRDASPHSTCPADRASGSIRMSMPTISFRLTTIRWSGKVIAWADTREQAIAKMRIALSEMIVEGIQTNLPLHQELMLDSAFIRGGTNIHYLEEKLSKQNRPD